MSVYNDILIAIASNEIGICLCSSKIRRLIYVVAKLPAITGDRYSLGTNRLA